MSMIFRACMRNICPKCGLYIEIDDIITSNPVHGRGVWHEACDPEYRLYSESPEPKPKPKSKLKVKSKPKAFVPVLTASEQERLKEFFKYANVG